MNVLPRPYVSSLRALALLLACFLHHGRALRFSRLRLVCMRQWSSACPIDRARFLRTGSVAFPPFLPLLSIRLRASTPGGNIELFLTRDSYIRALTLIPLMYPSSLPPSTQAHQAWKNSRLPLLLRLHETHRHQLLRASLRHAQVTGLRKDRDIKGNGD